MKRSIEWSDALIRREFLTSTALIAAGAAVGTLPMVAGAQRPTHEFNDTTHRNSSKKTRKLGVLEVSEMGTGCMSIRANMARPLGGR